MERKDTIKIAVFGIIREQETLQKKIRRLEGEKAKLVEELDEIEAKEK